MQKFITYQLFIKNDQNSFLKIGKLGTFFFPVGEYIYTGSAKRGMISRLERHQRKNKKKRWHIDYFVCSKSVNIVSIKQFSENECEINQQTKGLSLIPGFGSSDCQNKCTSHLKYIG